jgi:hypothetical protein
MVNARKYLGKYFLKLKDIKVGPLQETIIAAEEGTYGLELLFESGNALSLNQAMLGRWFGLMATTLTGGSA